MNVKENVIIKNTGENPEYSGDPTRLFDEIGEYSFINHSNSIETMINFFNTEFSSNNNYLIKEH